MDKIGFRIIYADRRNVIVVIFELDDCVVCRLISTDFRNKTHIKRSNVSNLSIVPRPFEFIRKCSKRFRYVSKRMNSWNSAILCVFRDRVRWKKNSSDLFFGRLAHHRPAAAFNVSPRISYESIVADRRRHVENDNISAKKKENKIY